MQIHISISLEAKVALGEECEKGRPASMGVGGVGGGWAVVRGWLGSVRGFGVVGNSWRAR